MTEPLRTFLFEFGAIGFLAWTLLKVVAVTLPLILAVAFYTLFERKVIGCLMGSTRLRVDVPQLVALYQHGRLKLDELITNRYPLERINEAIAAMETGEALRNVIIF